MPREPITEEELQQLLAQDPANAAFLLAAAGGFGQPKAPGGFKDQGRAPQAPAPAPTPRAAPPAAPQAPVGPDVEVGNGSTWDDIRLQGQMIANPANNRAAAAPQAPAVGGGRQIAPGDVMKLMMGAQSETPAAQQTPAAEPDPQWNDRFMGAIKDILAPLFGQPWSPGWINPYGNGAKKAAPGKMHRAPNETFTQGNSPEYIQQLNREALRQRGMSPEQLHIMALTGEGPET